MAESNVVWLSDQAPTPEDHLSFARDKQRERLLDKAHSVLGSLSTEQLQEIIGSGENIPS